MVECEANNQSSDVMEGIPSPVVHQKQQQRDRKKSRNKDSEINPSLETAIPTFVLEKALGGKPNEKMNNKTKKHPGSVTAPKKLAVESVKKTFIESVKQHQVVIIGGQPGSGKSTKLPQYLFRDVLNSEKRIICTEPRRMAVRSIATRVAEEMATKMGRLVGYRVRFDNHSKPETAIMFVTEGILLRELESDPLLGKYAVVILDDVHERSIRVDLLMSLLKSAMARRPDLKVIITSATLETTKFVKFFPGASVVSVPYITPFPVQIFYEKDEGDRRYVETAVKKVFSIHETTKPGDILIFLTGEEDITRCCQLLCNRNRRKDLWILPCYSALPLEKLSLVFEPIPRGYKRKVVVATNIAESSITIDGIVYVIDAGRFKQREYNSQAHIWSLRPIKITRVQAKQRAGRVGRTQPGFVYRLYSERDYNKMKKNLKPEILRNTLKSMVMMLAAHKVEEFDKFDFMDHPKSEDMEKAIIALQELGALDLQTNELTPVGVQLARMPLEPADAPLNTLEAGDHIALIEAYKIVLRYPNSKDWCNFHHVGFFGFQEVLAIRNQLASVLRNFCGAPPPSKVKHEIDTEKIYKCILSGFFCNIAHKVDSEKGVGASYKRYPNKKKNASVYVHPASILFHVSSPDWVIYQEVLKNNSQPYICNVIPVKPEWIQDVAPEFYSKFCKAFPPAPAN